MFPKLALKISKSTSAKHAFLNTQLLKFYFIFQLQYQHIQFKDNLSLIFSIPKLFKTQKKYKSLSFYSR